MNAITTDIDTTPQGQSSPRTSVTVRTDTLRHCLNDLRDNGWEIAHAMGATGTREITLDDGTELILTQRGAGGGMWYPQTCVACRLDRAGDTVREYEVYVR